MSGTLAVLESLREILATTLRLCQSIPNAPEAVEDAVLRYMTVYFGIEEISELARRSASSAATAKKDTRLLKPHLEAARAAGQAIKETLIRRPAAIRKRGSQWRPSGDMAVFIVSKLSAIMDAINSTALLVAMYVTHTDLLAC